MTRPVNVLADKLGENTHRSVASSRRKARGVDRQVSLYLLHLLKEKPVTGLRWGMARHGEGAGTSPNWNARNSGAALAPHNAQVSRTFPGRG